MEKRNVTVAVYENDSCNYELPERPDEFMSFWKEHLDKIPREYYDTAKIEVEGECSYDCGDLSVKVSYVRPETDEELAVREKRKRDNEKLIENRELCELERLKEKFGV